jgi:hypothetical protein
LGALFETRANSLAFERNAWDHFATHGVGTVAAHELLTPAQTQAIRAFRRYADAEHV